MDYKGRIFDKIEEQTGETLDDLIKDAALSQLENILGYDPLEGETIDLTLGRGQEVLYLIKRPVTSIIDVKINRVSQDLNNYEIYNKIGILKLDGIFYRGNSPYHVSSIAKNTVDERVMIKYIGGFTDKTFPGDLLTLLMHLVEDVKGVETGEGKLKAYKIRDISYTFKSDNEKMELYKSIVDKYRKI